MGKERVDISIIIPLYNAKKFIKRAISSINISNNYKYEIIIIDDASTDDSLEIVKEIKDYNIKIITNSENKGVSYSRNLGIKIANGTYIAFLDADDFVDKNMYDDMLEFAYRKNSDICVTNYNEVFDNRICKSKYIYNDFDTQQTIKLFLNDKISMAVWDKLFKKVFLEKHNILFNENIKIGEDVIFVLDAFLKSENNAFLQKYSYNYYQNEKSVMHKISDKMIDLATIPNMISIENQSILEKEFESDWNKFKIIEMLKSIHAISRCNQNSFYERKKYIEQVLNKEYERKILKSKDFDKSLKFEILVLKYFGIYIHLLMFPVYDKVKKVIRSER